MLRTSGAHGRRVQSANPVHVRERTLAAFRRRIPVDTPAIGTLGARIAALLTIAILANSRPDLREKLSRFRAKQSEKVARDTLA
jgi:phosphoribosylcarboxyaminoimidazole (NCAIR) mutase